MKLANTAYLESEKIRAELQAKENVPDQYKEQFRVLDSMVSDRIESAIKQGKTSIEFQFNGSTEEAYRFKRYLISFGYNVTINDSYFLVSWAGQGQKILGVL
jgi:hypothetical protein